MSIRKISIIVDRQEKNIIPGLKQGSELIHAFGIKDPEQLLLEISGDIDVPVAHEDFLLLTGGEVFSIGDGSPRVEDNPQLRHPIRFMFNEHKLSEHQALRHPKITGADLKRLDPEAAPGSRLIADLEGFADEAIGDHQRIIVKPSDQFIVMPPPESPPYPHEVTVSIDGRHVTLKSGEYLVSVLKQKLGVPPEYELELVERGQFHPLADGSNFKLHKPEEFISHLRTGSSS